MRIGYIGLGKMGKNMALLLSEKGHEIVAFNRSAEPRDEARKEGLNVVDSIKEVIDSLPERKIVWLMVSHQGVDAVIGEILPFLKGGDIIIDGGNSNYKDSIRRGSELKERGIHFLDAGVSGGPRGAREGACVMVGGDPEIYQELEVLFKDMSAPNAYRRMGGNGAGHFVKMVHNGIEYGMMQAIAEGFEVMKASPFDLDLFDVADLYNQRSVIESRLVGWLKSGFEEYGKDLDAVSSTVSHTGEGEWTIKAAEEFGVPVPVIKESLEFRKRSKDNPSFAGKVLSALRNQFGGHSIGSKE